MATTTMMATTTLAEGSRFALTSNLQKNKSMIFVKLTDSAVKAVEDYVNAIVKGDIDEAQKALFQLYPNAKGLLTIPGASGESHDYNFSIKDIQNDGGLLECLHQRDDHAMDSLGKVRLRMQIHANDDIYQATKHKMALAQEESKKGNTVVLDDDQATGTIITRKVKRPFATKFNGAGNANLSAIHNTSNTSNPPTNGLSNYRSKLSNMPKSDNNSPPLLANQNSPASTSNSPSMANGRASSSPFGSRAGLLAKRARDGSMSVNVSKKLKAETMAGAIHRANLGRSTANRTSPPINLKPNGTSANRHSDHDSMQYKGANGASHAPNHHNSRMNSGNGSGSINSSPNSSPDSVISSQPTAAPFHNLNSDSSNGLAFDGDYLSKYTRIQNDEQLLRYKRDFDCEYPNYKKLYDYVENICRQFTELRESISGKEEESEEWNELIKQTIEKYDEIKNRSTYSSSSKRLCQLHAKLTHIKNLINDYLHHQGNKC